MLDFRFLIQFSLSFFLSGTWESQTALSRRLSYDIPPLPQSDQLTDAGTAIAVPEFGRTAARPHTFSPVSPHQSRPASGLLHNPQIPLYHDLAVPSRSSTSLGGLSSVFGNNFISLSGLPGLAESGFSTSFNFAGRGDSAQRASATGALGVPGASLTSLVSLSSSQPQPDLLNAAASDPSVPNNFSFTTAFTTALTESHVGRFPPWEINHSTPAGTASSPTSSLNASNPAVSAGPSDGPQQTHARLPQSPPAASGNPDFNLALLTTANPPATLSDVFPPCFEAETSWPSIDDPTNPAPHLPPHIARDVASLYEAYTNLATQTDEPVRSEDDQASAQHDNCLAGAADERNADDTIQTTLDSPIHAMPPTASRKRRRTAAAPDEPAGPSTATKRRRSHSSRASVSGRPASSKARKSSRPATTLVIADSDDVFAVDDEGEQQLFDLTKDDKLPDELLAKAKEEDEDENSTKLMAFECIICMDSATNLTVTHCGMLSSSLYPARFDRICTRL